MDRVFGRKHAAKMPAAMKCQLREAFGKKSSDAPMFWFYGIPCIVLVLAMAVFHGEQAANELRKVLS